MTYATDKGIPVLSTGYTYEPKPTLPTKAQIVALRDECLRLGMTEAAAAWDNAIELTGIQIDAKLAAHQREHTSGIDWDSPEYREAAKAGEEFDMSKIEEIKF